MSNANLTWPLVVIGTFALLLALLLLGALPSNSVAQTVDDRCPTASYPDPAKRQLCQQTAVAQISTETADSATETAEAAPIFTSVAQTEAAIASAYPAARATNPPTSQPQQPQPQPIEGATPTLTPTSTSTATDAPPTSALPTLVPTSTPRLVATSALTGTADPLGGLLLITCPRDSTVTLEGQARPTTALLVYFDQRPVGGTLSRSDGSYTIFLRIGNERPGLYPVAIRERDSYDLVRELACEVPGATPTPTLPEPTFLPNG